MVPGDERVAYVDDGLGLVERISSPASAIFTD
jgi:D-serine dehydratase